MKRFSFLALALALTGCFESSNQANAAPSIPSVENIQLVTGHSAVGHRNFNGAKKVLPEVFKGMQEDFYCGCPYQGKTMNLAACGYIPRKNEKRAERLEWEHVVPAWVLGHQRQCWQDGGRKNCTSHDKVFQMAEGDLVNLVPSVGEVNGDRSNFSYSQWTSKPVSMYGKCQTIVDFKDRKAQPRAEVRGRIARIYFYMFQTYGLKMSDQDKKLMCAWAKQHPVDQWEKTRNIKIQSLQGSANNFVSNPSNINKVCQ